MPPLERFRATTPSRSVTNLVLPTRAILPILMGALLAPSLLAQPLPVSQPRDEGFDATRLQRVRQVIEGYLADGRHAGAAWAIARNGKTVDYQSAGLRNVESGLKMERDTICRIYSMSKIVTSVAVLTLMEEGRVVLDDPVEKFLPELKGPKVFKGGTMEAPEMEDSKSAVTLRHLLTHTSGYAYDFDGNDPVAQLYKAQDLWNSSSLKEFTGKVAKLPLRHHPGEQFTYGINTDILGAVIEAVSGQSFEDFLQTRICRPLGMKDTSFDVPPAKTNRLARIYSTGAQGKLTESQDFLGAYAEAGKGIPCGGAGLFSTVADYTRFGQMLLNGGELEGQRILGRKTVELMTANHLLTLPGKPHAFSPSKGFGLGVEVQLDPGFSPLLVSEGQFGWYGAATTYCQIDPKEKIVAVLFVQHFPFNQHGVFGRFQNAYFQALTR